MEEQKNDRKKRHDILSQSSEANVWIVLLKSNRQALLHLKINSAKHAGLERGGTVLRTSWYIHLQHCMILFPVLNWHEIKPQVIWHMEHSVKE